MLNEDFMPEFVGWVLTTQGWEDLYSGDPTIRLAEDALHDALDRIADKHIFDLFLQGEDILCMQRRLSDIFQRIAALSARENLHFLLL